MSFDVGASTYVSTPGTGPGVTAASAPGAPGSGGPGSNISMTSAVLIPMGTAAVGLAVLWKLFKREGAGLPPLRVDPASAAAAYFSWLLIQTPVKLLAYKYHGHKLAQAILLVA